MPLFALHQLFNIKSVFNDHTLAPCFLCLRWSSTLNHNFNLVTWTHHQESIRHHFFGASGGTWGETNKRHMAQIFEAQFSYNSGFCFYLDSHSFKWTQTLKEQHWRRNMFHLVCDSVWSVCIIREPDDDRKVANHDVSDLVISIFPSMILCKK